MNQDAQRNTDPSGDTAPDTVPMGQSAPDYAEVYRQRYETFRHLDRVRWQMLQIAVGIGSVVLAFGGDARGPQWWVVGAVGALLLTCGVVMERIRGGIDKNGAVLRKVGARIGDHQIPDTSGRWFASSFWIALALIGAGVGCFWWSACLR